MNISERLAEAGRVVSESFNRLAPPPLGRPMRPWSRVLVAAVIVILLGIPFAWLAGLFEGSTPELRDGPFGGESLQSTTLTTADGSMAPPASDTTITVEPTADGVWTVYEFDLLEPRIGMSATTVGGDVLFVWGGAREYVGTVYNDGALIELRTGTGQRVPAAPLDGRMKATVVWTGSEFIVFSGQDFDRSYADGAAYDPATMTWRPLPDAPLTPASHPTAIWAADAMYVWLPSRDTPYAEIPNASAGQFARYRPNPNTWELLASPPADGHTARLLELNGRPLLLIGPQLLGYGTPGPTRSVTAVAYDTDQDVWLTPVHGPATDDAAAVTVDESVLLLGTNGRIGEFSRGRWTAASSIVPECPLAVDAAAGSSRAYFVLCLRAYLSDRNGLREITLPQQPIILCCQQVLQATEDGTLVVLTWAGPAGTGTPADMVLLAIYTPTDTDT